LKKKTFKPPEDFAAPKPCTTLCGEEAASMTKGQIKTGIPKPKAKAAVATQKTYSNPTEAAKAYIRERSLRTQEKRVLSPRLNSFRHGSLPSLKNAETPPPLPAVPLLVSASTCRLPKGYCAPGSPRWSPRSGRQYREKESGQQTYVDIFINKSLRCLEQAAVGAVLRDKRSPRRGCDDSFYADEKGNAEACRPGCIGQKVGSKLSRLAEAVIPDTSDASDASAKIANGNTASGAVSNNVCPLVPHFGGRGEREFAESR
jgi:hypothetical protein